MWRNLRDVGSLAQKISAVVAPPMDGDSSFNHSIDSENDDNHPNDDEFDEAESDYDENESQEKSDKGSSPFGFMSLIARNIIKVTPMEASEHCETEIERENTIEDSTEKVEFSASTKKSSIKSDVDPGKDEGHSNFTAEAQSQTDEVAKTESRLETNNDDRYDSPTEHHTDLVDGVPQPLHLQLHREKGSLSPGRGSTKRIVSLIEKSNSFPDSLLVNTDDEEDGFESEEDNLDIKKADDYVPIGTRLNNDESSLLHVLEEVPPQNPQLRYHMPSKTASPEQHLKEPSKMTSPNAEMVQESKSDSALNYSDRKAVLESTLTDGAEDELQLAKHDGVQSELPESEMPMSEILVDPLPASSPPIVETEGSVPTNPAQDSVKIEIVAFREESKSHIATESSDCFVNKLNGDGSALKMNQLELHCRQFQQELTQRDNEIILLKTQLSEMTMREELKREKIMEMFKEKEERLLLATDEDHQNEIIRLKDEMKQKIQTLQQELLEERETFKEEHKQIEFLLNEANERAEKAERAAHQVRTQNENNLAQIQQQHARTLRITEDKLVQALAKLDEKEENERNLKATLQALKSKMNEHHEGAKEVEDELEEIHAENEKLMQKLEKVENEKKQLRAKVEKLQGDSEKLSHMKLEMMLLKEDNEREKAKRQNVAASAESTNAQLVADRDSALAEVQDLKQQLAAALADVEMAKADSERLTIASNNLQGALESFQMERDAEYAIWQENKVSDEAALEAAHSAALAAMIQMHETQMQRVQEVSDAAVMNSMKEIKQLEAKVEMLRTENAQMRRSLDEAINRLQVTQDDVIDRAFMKNVLFDWLTKKGVKERRDVLELMASILHFTEEEKEQVHIGHSTGFGLLVGPLPQSKADIEHLGGDNVREKFVNFLLAETED